MGELVAAFRLVERFGGKLKVLSPSERVHSTLSIAKLLPIFEIFEDEGEALDSFPAAPKE